MGKISEDFQQVYNIEEIFRAFFQHYTPDRIIELGTMSGKFTWLINKLRSETDSNFDMFTFDINNYFNYRAVWDMPKNTSFCQMDIINNFPFIGGLIKENTLILCDNGNKVKEVNGLAPYLKKDCVIMAHDYAFDEERQKELNIWDYLEIQWKDVKHLNLIPYMEKLMERGAWLSLKKQ